jgi:hypothetical protein
VGVTAFKTVGIGSIGRVNLRQTFEMSLYSQKIGVWCAITASQIVVEPMFFETLIFTGRRETF